MHRRPRYADALTTVTNRQADVNVMPALQTRERANQPAAECLGCGAALSTTADLICRTCMADPFAMEDARRRAAERGFVDELATLYSSKYSFLPEGRISALWEDNLLEQKDTIPDFSRWRIARSVALVPGTSRRVLDIGVGTGDALRGLQQKLPGAELYGIDLSENILHSIARDVRGSFARATIEDVPWPGVQFDAILMLEVLEHVEVRRTLNVLRTLQERLSPNGVLIISVPLWENLRRSFFICSHCGERIHQIGHLRSYSPVLLRAELSLAGYIVDKEVPLAGGRYFGIPRQWLMPILPERVRPMVLVTRSHAAPESRI